MTTVCEWSQIADYYTDALVLGNGASISIDSRYKYDSLYLEALRMGLISPSVQRIFDHFVTTDFEFVLRLLWHAQLVNAALEIPGESTQSAYTGIRNALIGTLRAIHAPYEDVVDRLTMASQYMGRFKTVASLNYDLLVYWAMIIGSEASPNRFKDCFVQGDFQHNWCRFRKPWGNSQSATLVFYPHGNLVLGADLRGVEKKIQTEDHEQLLDTIIRRWENADLASRFVSEGTSELKLDSILSSPYLRTVYSEVLPEIGHSVVTFGWSMSEQDDHLLKAMCKGQIRRFAVSVLPDSDHLDEMCARVERRLREELKSNHFELQFFDANSPGCWIAS